MVQESMLLSLFPCHLGKNIKTSILEEFSLLNAKALPMFF